MSNIDLEEAASLMLRSISIQDDEIERLKTLLSRCRSVLEESLDDVYQAYGADWRIQCDDEMKEWKGMIEAHEQLVWLLS